MKKIISLLLAAILAMSLLAGCTGTPDNDTTSEPTEVTTEPTTEPTEAPTEEPTEAPTEEPTEAPTESEEKTWALTVPEGFMAFADTEAMAMWMTEDPTTDASQIMTIVMPYDETVLTTSQEDFAAGMAASYDEGSLVINEYTTTEIDGFPALFVDYTCVVEGITMHSYTYFVVASQTYSFMFNDCSAEGTWAEAFQQAAQTIDILEDAAA